MKTNLSPFRAAVFGGAFLLFATNSTLQAAGPKKEHGEHGHTAMAQSAASAAVATMHQLHAELAAQIKGRQLKSVHETCEQLTAAAKTLPAVSKDLPADKLMRVEGSVKHLAKALDSLHAAAAAGNQANSEKHLKQVDSLLSLISSQYAAKGGDMKKSGHDH